MANETTITIRGNLGSDPTKFEGANGCATRFNVAVSVAKFRQDKEKVESLPPQWFAVKAFGELGRNVAESVGKGTPVIVRGELVTEYWTDTAGQDRSRQVIRADSVGIDLRNGTARHVRTVRNSPEADATDGAPTPLPASPADAHAEQQAPDVDPFAAGTPQARPTFDVSDLELAGGHSSSSPDEVADADGEQSLAEFR